MTMSQIEQQQTSSGSNDEVVIFDENSKRQLSPSQTKRNPPARNTSRFWFERFLAVIQRQNPTAIDISFLSQIAPSNEGKLLAQLKFLRVIDDQGKPTKVLPMLNMVGEEQKRAFREIANDAYQELLSEVKIDKAVPDDLVNFFIRKYSFTRDKGVNAAKFFLYLAEKGGVQVSSDLGSFLTEKSSIASQPSGVSITPGTKLADRQGVRIQGKEARNSALNLSRQSNHRRSRLTGFEDRSPIQAIININLEKDTPREYWDRVLALLGERQQAEDSPAETSRKYELSENDSLDRELSPDPAFT